MNGEEKMPVDTHTKILATIGPSSATKEQLSLLDLNEKQERPELEFSQEFIDTFFQEQNPERKFYIYRQLQSSLSTNENITFLKKYM